MGCIPFRCCCRCAQSAAALAAALGIAVMPMCYHEYGSHPDLPEVEVRSAMSEPTVSATGGPSNTTITPGTGSVTLTGYAPTVSTA